MGCPAASLHSTQLNKTGSDAGVQGRSADHAGITATASVGACRLHCLLSGTKNADNSCQRNLHRTSNFERCKNRQYYSHDQIKITSSSFLVRWESHSPPGHAEGAVRLGGFGEWRVAAKTRHASGRTLSSRVPCYGGQTRSLSWSAGTAGRPPESSAPALSR